MCFFKFMADRGIWDIIQTLVAIAGGIAILFYVFPRRSIENFYINATRGSEPAVHKSNSHRNAEFNK